MKCAIDISHIVVQPQNPTSVVTVDGHARANQSSFQETHYPCAVGMHYFKQIHTLRLRNVLQSVLGWVEDLHLHGGRRAHQRFEHM